MLRDNVRATGQIPGYGFNPHLDHLKSQQHILPGKTVIFIISILHEVDNKLGLSEFIECNLLSGRSYQIAFLGPSFLIAMESSVVYTILNDIFTLSVHVLCPYALQLFHPAIQVPVDLFMPCHLSLGHFSGDCSKPVCTVSCHISILMLGWSARASGGFKKSIISLWRGS